MQVPPMNLSKQKVQPIKKILSQPVSTQHTLNNYLEKLVEYYSIPLN